MGRHTLPKTGSRTRRVLDALFAFPVGPVEESALMAYHYLNNCSAAHWRKDVYQKLQDAFLIACHGGGLNGPASWTLTDKGRRLMLAEQRSVQAAASADELDRDAPAVIDTPIVPPRTVRPFRPMATGTVGMRVMRDGALDYQTIPSMMGGQRCA